MQRTLDEVYGKGQVSLVQAVFRWMNHHSQLKRSGRHVYSYPYSVPSLICQLQRSVLDTGVKCKLGGSIPNKLFRVVRVCCTVKDPLRKDTNTPK